MKDTRARYYYTISIEGEKAFEGYLLHEEAWYCVSDSTKKNISAHYLYGKVSKETDKKFKEFKKTIS